MAASSTSYTKPLWNVRIATNGTTTGPLVPAGKLWVVRDVTLNLYHNIPSARIGYAWLQEQKFGTTLWGAGYSETTGGRVLHSELRQAVAAGNGLQFVCETPGWFVAVTGFEFSVP